jgi:hypothetical protein
VHDSPGSRGLAQRSHFRKGGAAFSVRLHQDRGQNLSVRKPRNQQIRMFEEKRFDIQTTPELTAP